MYLRAFVWLRMREDYRQLFCGQLVGREDDCDVLDQPYLLALAARAEKKKVPTGEVGTSSTEPRYQQA